MKKSSYLVTALTAGAIILGMHLTSCEHYVLPEMSITPDTLIFSAAGGEQAVSVKSNVIWSMEINDSEATYVEWITCSPRWANESCESVITLQPNTGGMRQLTIPVKTETIKRSLTIIQEGTDL